MLVQGKGHLLTNQSLGKKTKKSDSNDSSFDKVLSNTHKKKNHNKKAAPKKVVAKKLRSNINDMDDTQAHQKPVIKENKPNQKSEIKPQIAEVKSQKMQPSIQSLKELPKNQEGAEQMVAKKFQQEGIPKMQGELSLNSSELDKNSLVKNQDITKDLKKLNQELDQFQAQMDEMKLDQMQKKSGEKSSLGMLPKVQNNPYKMQQSGQLKMDGMTKASGTLAAPSLGEMAKAVKPAGMQQKASGESSREGLSNLESMITQALEQNGAENSVDSADFSKELMIGAEQGKSEKIENMNSIVKQARAFVKDGGGEMQIHLQPEGLGKVQLKVAVNDGQVNVEMFADNMAAKRALEEGLVDIKQALEGQKLLVETLKVEMAQDYQKDFSDLANHMQEQANRDFAEQFLGQFRQEREERFGGMFDSFRTMQRATDEPELSLKRNPYSESGKGRTINLVA